MDLGELREFLLEQGVSAEELGCRWARGVYSRNGEWFGIRPDGVHERVDLLGDGSLVSDVGMPTLEVSDAV